MEDRQTKPMVVAASGERAAERGVGPGGDENGWKMPLEMGRCEPCSGAWGKQDWAASQWDFSSPPLVGPRSSCAGRPQRTQTKPRDSQKLQATSSGAVQEGGAPPLPGFCVVPAAQWEQGVPGSHGSGHYQPVSSRVRLRHHDVPWGPQHDGPGQGQSRRAVDSGGQGVPSPWKLCVPACHRVCSAEPLHQPSAKDMGTSCQEELSKVEEVHQRPVGEQEAAGEGGTFYVDQPGDGPHRCPEGAHPLPWHIPQLPTAAEDTNMEDYLEEFKVTEQSCSRRQSIFTTLRLRSDLGPGSRPWSPSARMRATACPATWSPQERAGKMRRFFLPREENRASLSSGLVTRPLTQNPATVADPGPSNSSSAACSSAAGTRLGNTRGPRPAPPMLMGRRTF
ncbi:uncharacterized protein [Equus przewalskii]|uniref:Uncharacterized protein isoform X2 n=1 Tax=Equus przewalskii TaxID=9798 RepID=A0ABM4QE47_EQUPR